MGTKIYYSSGKVVELRDGEGQRFWGRAKNSGFRYYHSLDDVVIPFNHPTITHIELEGTENRDKFKVVAATASAPKVEDAVKPPQTYNEAQERAADIERKQFEAKASCTHKDQNGQTMRKIFFTDTVNGRKYFPVCTFCGHRERYVGVPKVQAGAHPLYTMNDIEAAMPYEEPR